MSLLRTLSSVIMAFLVQPSFAADTWQFVWVTSGNKWHVVEGTATVSINGGELHADLLGANGNKYLLEGRITKGSIRGKFTVLDSDCFIKSPFRGTYTRETYKGISPCGKELLHLSDGYNFLGIQRTLTEPECKP